ncbi:High-affinity choline transporter 1 [Takifugu flavidus]|uniref:High-affinity choline transporter 1 n=1 Tax=Takifugu flavidus TaxID=433684 RepID=A0A5C6PHM7_9TELE|nr:High-affinity choline transporter 1 [Takifugu flavidus]
MALNVPGLVATIIFYLLILCIGIWASIKSKRDEIRMQAHHTDMALLGDRRITLVVGIFTTTADTFVSFFTQIVSKRRLQFDFDKK